MENKKLMKILKTIGKVKSSRWNVVMEIVKNMDSIEVIEKNYHDDFKRNHPEIYPLDLSKLDTWSTYDGECINLIFKNENEKLVCDVSIYDGDCLNGYRTDLKFTAKLILPEFFISVIKENIVYVFDSFSNDA